MPDPKTQPTEFHLDRARHLEVRWSDGGKSTISLVQLRKACPYAACQATREERQRTLLSAKRAVGDPLEMVTVDAAELVGKYGLRIRWRDGHDAGIYDFTLLRSLG